MDGAVWHKRRQKFKIGTVAKALYGVESIGRLFPSRLPNKSKRHRNLEWADDTYLFLNEIPRTKIHGLI